MNNIKINTINEIEKLFLKKKFIVFIIIMAAISFLSTFFISSIQSKLIFIAMGSISFPLVILSMFTNILLPLFVFMAASELFPAELNDKALKLVLIRPISRFKIFISKILAIAFYVCLNLFVIFLSSTISCLLLHVNILSLQYIIFSYTIDIIPALILILFTVFIAQFFKSSSASIISCILIFIGVKVLSLFVSGLNNILFTSYLNWYSLWTFGTNNFFRIINIFLMLLAYGIIFFTVGYYIFDKREI